MLLISQNTEPFLDPVSHVKSQGDAHSSTAGHAGPGKCPHKDVAQGWGALAIQCHSEPQEE